MGTSVLHPSGARTSLVGWLSLILLLAVYEADTQTRTPGDENYCQWEDFSAQCGPGEVIVVNMARYGRMERGRCVKRNYGYLGCSMDVLPYVDSHCSGRRTCEFSIFDDSLRRFKPCPEDISSYLQARYTCLKVGSGSRSHCQRHRRVTLTGALGYIGSVESVENDLGTSSCPWRVQVSPGQRVNLTLYNFARYREPVAADDANAAGSTRADVCYELAEIRENGRKRRITLCDGMARHTPIYVSKTNVIDIQLVSGGTLETLGYFLLKYEAIGCPDLKVSGGSWTKRDGEEAIVKCNKTGQTRYLTCKGNQWIGEVGNCTSDDGGGLMSSVFSEDGIFPYGILIVVAIGVALGIFFGGLLLSVVVVYMRRRQQDPPETARELDESVAGDKLYMRYEVDVDKSYQRQASQDGGTLKVAQLPAPPGVNCDTLHSHHQGAELDMMKQAPPAPCGAPGTLTRPGSSQFSRQHIYESPTFT